MASMDLKRPCLHLSQFSDSQTYNKTLSKLQHLNALEVIMPNTACEGGNISVLYKKISNSFQDVNLVTVQRKYFNETKGVYIKCH